MLFTRYPEFVLPDKSTRTTFASESSEYPPCLLETGKRIKNLKKVIYPKFLSRSNRPSKKTWEKIGFERSGLALELF